MAGLLSRLRSQSRQRGERAGRRLRKRKAALALSAGVAGLSTAGMSNHAPPLERPAFSVSIDRRLPASLLSVSDELKHALIEEEGVRRTVYRDVAGYPTVGVGHLVLPEDGLRVGDRVSLDRVLDFLEQDLRIAEQAVGRLVGEVPLYQHEFDALVDLVFNVGEGNVSLAKSPRLNAAIAARDYSAMAEELGYHHADNRIARGLVLRSDRRANIFNLADYENPRPQASKEETA